MTIPLAELAIVRPFDEATAMLRGFANRKGIRIFNHKLVTDHEAVAIHFS
jgi:hypothetical protein